MTPSWREYSKEIGKLHGKGFIEGGIRPYIKKNDYEVGFTFWNIWTIKPKFTEGTPGLILSARHIIEKNLYHTFHFHPLISPPPIGWDCFDCYELQPLF